jgi:cell division septal protein FtsQ
VVKHRKTKQEHRAKKANGWLIAMMLPIVCMLLVFAAPLLTMLVGLYRVAAMERTSLSARETRG